MLIIILKKIIWGVNIRLHDSMYEAVYESLSVAAGETEYFLRAVETDRSMKIWQIR